MVVEIMVVEIEGGGGGNRGGGGGGGGYCDTNLGNCSGQDGANEGNGYVDIYLTY